MYKFKDQEELDSFVRKINIRVKKCSNFALSKKTQAIMMVDHLSKT